VPTVHPSVTGGGRRADLGRVLVLLRRREAALRSKTAALLLFGVPLSFIGPAVFTMIGWAMWARHHRTPYPFWTAFLVISAVSLPLLYLLAWSLKGSVLEHGAETMGTFTQRRAAGGLMFFEIANAGPRMVLHGVSCHNARRRSGAIDLRRAAEAICTMFASDTAVSPAKLLRPGEPPDQLEPLLSFLMFHQIADVSAAGDRVWLNSDVRRAVGDAR
jgi:hypothetical protein